MIKRIKAENIKVGDRIYLLGSWHEVDSITPYGETDDDVYITFEHHYHMSLSIPFDIVVRVQREEGK